MAYLQGWNTCNSQWVRNMPREIKKKKRIKSKVSPHLWLILTPMIWQRRYPWWKDHLTGVKWCDYADRQVLMRNIVQLLQISGSCTERVHPFQRFYEQQTTSIECYRPSESVEHLPVHSCIPLTVLQKGIISFFFSFLSKLGIRVPITWPTARG